MHQVRLSLLRTPGAGALGKPAGSVRSAGFVTLRQDWRYSPDKETFPDPAAA